MTARDVMTSGIVYCTEDQSIEDAIHMMEEKQIRRMPGIDGKKRMTGMLSLGDLAHATRREITGEFAQAESAHQREARETGLYATFVARAVPGAAANIPPRCFAGPSAARNAPRLRHTAIGGQGEKNNQ